MVVNEYLAKFILILFLCNSFPLCCINFPRKILNISAVYNVLHFIGIAEISNKLLWVLGK